MINIKKIFIGIIILIIISIIILFLSINNEKIDYASFTIDKLNEKESYTLNVQISKLGNNFNNINLNYLIEGENFSLDVYENDTNSFYQKYNGEYYKGDKKVESFEFSDYKKFINILKKINNIKKSKDGYTGTIKSLDLTDYIETNEDGQVSLKIKNNIIKSISIVPKNTTEYTININYD